MKRQPLTLLAASAFVLVLCTGCPYASKFSLSGEPVKYSKNITGEWHSEAVELKISALDEYRLKVHYNDHEADDPNIVDGTAKVVKQNSNTYLVLEEEKGSGFYVAKVLSAGKSELQLNILDDSRIKQKGLRFSSEKDFSDFVFSSTFPESEKTTFTRRKVK